MIIRTHDNPACLTTDKAIRISIFNQPEWNEHYKRYYVAGFRWIKSKQRFSSNCLLHNFRSYTVEEDVR